MSTLTRLSIRNEQDPIDLNPRLTGPEWLSLLGEDDLDGALQEAEKKVRAAIDEWEVKEAARRAELDLQEVAAAEELLPLLESAREQDVYVRSAYVDHQTSRDLGIATGVIPYVASRNDQLFWAGGLRELSRRGIRTQMIYREHGRGVVIEGYRLAPDGDERKSVNIEDVFAESGRCRKCGMTKEYFGDERWPRCHSLSNRHEWPQ
ncbi:MAG TPA: hypothetical protein VNA68_00895 [Candidatus Dormibacteraeota bacterium]|nr:hypothetical protein [Candidatus Dormibacteraeota bacterium]